MIRVSNRVNGSGGDSVQLTMRDQKKNQSGCIFYVGGGYNPVPHCVATATHRLTERHGMPPEHGGKDREERRKHQKKCPLWGPDGH